MNKDTLITDNIPLVYYAIKKMNLWSRKEDYIDIGMIGLVIAGNNYNENLGYAFTTYAYKVIANEINKEIIRENSGKRRHKEISLSTIVAEDASYIITLEDTIASDVDIESELLYKEKLDMLDMYVDTLPAKEKVVLIYYYGLRNTKKLTQQEIADVLKINQPNIGRTIKRAERMLGKKMKKYL